MVETGSYNVNKKRRRDTSFKSFICALLAFLAMLILISLLLYALRNKAGGGDDLDTNRDDRFELEFLKGKNNTKKENKTLVVSTVSTTTTAQNTTTTPSTSSTHENANSIIKNLTEDESSTTTLLPSTDRNANLIPENSTEDQITTTTLLPSTDRNANLITENSTEDQITTTNKIRSTTEEYIFPDDESGTPTRYTTVGPTPDPVPTTCKNGICKRAASSMLAIMNHDDKLNRCEDYYKFICEGPEQNDEHAFFHESFKGFVKKINEVTPTSEKYMTLFADFYKSCNEFGNSINRLERLKCLIGTEGADLTKSVTTAILAQTLSFFDIGLNINGKNFKLEINLPGLSYLKTTLKDWSLMEQLTDTCINKQSDEINQNVIELDKISTNITKCIVEKATQYVKDFVNEMKQISVLSGFEFLDANVKAATQNDDLIEILNVVQESLAAYRNTNLKKLKETTLLDLNKNYDFGLDWIELFKGITNDLTVDEKTVVYQSEHLEEVFKKLIEKKANLQPLVDLWHNIELYKNIVIEKEIDDRGFNCLEITSELMPEVSSAIISELNANDQQDFYKEVESLMNNLKSNVYTSFTQANMTTESADVLQDRLSEIKIIMPTATPEVDKLNYRKVFDPNDPYPKKMVSLISHFRKTLFAMHDNVVVGDTLMKYFVNAFATKPKSFPPSRAIVVQPGFFYGKSLKMPKYVTIAKLGLPLAMQISGHFTKNNFEKPLKQREEKIYEEMEKSFDTNYLMNKIKYTVENKDFEVEDVTGNHLSYDNIFSDNMAFRLETDTFAKDKSLEYLPFMQDYTREQSFIIIALQEYCHKNTIVDFIDDYYNRRLPAPLRFRNMLKNSEFYSKAFNCSEPFERKQFPYINPSSP